MSDTVKTEPKSLDEIMLAMDVVDTLRHRKRLVEKELNAEGRRENLIARLRDIYHSQGIDVSDEVLEEGVLALEEDRFTYHPPKKSFQTSLARLYVARRKFLRPMALVAGMTAFLYAAYWGTIVQPQQAAVQKAEIALNQDLPMRIEALKKASETLAVSSEAQMQLKSVYQQGISAIEAKDLAAAQASITKLENLRTQLQQSYTIRIVSESGQLSGVWRVPDVNTQAHNYYLIVEAVDETGQIIALDVLSEESGKVKRVKKWGLRVSQSTYEAVGRNKQDDGIIQGRNIGAKQVGVLEPSYTITTGGGMIWEW